MESNDLLLNGKLIASLHKILFFVTEARHVRYAGDGLSFALGNRAMYVEDATSRAIKIAIRKSTRHAQSQQ